MTGIPVDRRVARTQTQLHHALMSLILKKGYEATTVEDICEGANVGRSTFYGHYSGKDDLLRSGFAHLRTALVERQKQSQADDDGSRPLGFSLVMFEHAKAHLDQYKAHVGDRGGTIARDAVRRILTDLVRNELDPAAGKSSKEAPPREAVVQFVVGAYLAVLTWWLDSGAKRPAHEIDAMFRSIALDGIAPWVRRRRRARWGPQARVSTAGRR